MICNNCGHEEPIGAIICSECGSHFVDEEGIPTQSVRIKRSEIAEALEMLEKVTSHKTPDEAGVVVALRFSDIDQEIYLDDGDEYILGRASLGQRILPDIDLSKYGAYQCGVSRLHASVTVDGEDVIIRDLGSSNGTWLNDKQLIPYKSFPVHPGDKIEFGKLRLLVNIK